MGVDRMLVVSMTAKHGTRSFFLVILPRLLLGLLLSIVISTPIVLQIFRPEIDQEIGLIHQQQISAAAQGAQNDQLGQEITALKTQIKSLTQQIAQTSNQIASLNQQYLSAASAAQAANAQYQCQISGLPGCVAGNGPLAKTAAGNYQGDQRKAAAIQGQIQPAAERPGDAGPAAAAHQRSEPAPRGPAGTADGDRPGGSGHVPRQRPADQAAGARTGGRPQHHCAGCPAPAVPAVRRHRVHAGPGQGAAERGRHGYLRPSAAARQGRPASGRREDVGRQAGRRR